MWCSFAGSDPIGVSDRNPSDLATMSTKDYRLWSAVCVCALDSEKKTIFERGWQQQGKQLGWDHIRVEKGERIMWRPG